MRIGVTHISTRKLIVLLIIICVTAIRLFAPQDYILSAIERAEIYSGTCISLDPECSLTAENKVDLGDAPTSALNLFLHLISVTANEEDTAAVPLVDLVHILNAVVISLPMWVFRTHIFRPPRF